MGRLVEEIVSVQQRQRIESRQLLNQRDLLRNDNMKLHRDLTGVLGSKFVNFEMACTNGTDGGVL